MEERLRHTGVKAGEIGRYVFIPGSVERARSIAAHFDEPRLIRQKREFLTYSGYLDGEMVTVTSTGIGGPSTAITVEELSSLGADTFIRIGSCASTSLLSSIGDVIIPGGAARLEGTGDYYLPEEFPAVPDFETFCCFVDAAKKCGYPFNTGVTITKDSFYTQTTPETKPNGDELKFLWDAYEKAGATNTSMECSLLFLMGAVMKLRTLSVMICATNYHAYSNDKRNYPKDWENRAIEVGIEGMRLLIKKDRESAGEARA